MKNRYRYVVDSDSLYETKKLLKEYHNALLQIKQADLDSEDQDILWIDKSTPVSLWIDMHLQEMINVDEPEDDGNVDGQDK